MAQYLDEEIAFIKGRLKGFEDVLEIGSGYGRIIKQIAPSCRTVTGIDISEKNVIHAHEYLRETSNAETICEDIFSMNSTDRYDVVLCMQNGISAISGDVSRLVSIVMQSMKNDGFAYLSTYSDRFWDYRLEWFVEQQDKGLIGEIDFEKTGNGVICCKDGFVSRSYSEDELRDIGRNAKCKYEIMEVDESSVFLVLNK